MPVFVDPNLEKQHTRSLAHLLRGLAAQQLHRQHHILQRRQRGKQVERLKYKAHPLASETILPPTRETSHIHSIDPKLSLCAFIHPAHDIELRSFSRTA